MNGKNKMKLSALLTALMFSAPCLTAGDRITTFEYQDVLMKRTCLAHRNRQDSLVEAFTKLHERLVEALNPTFLNGDKIFHHQLTLQDIFNQNNQNINDRLTQIGADNQIADRMQKFLSITSTLLNFVGWNAHASNIMTSVHRNYNDYLNVIRLIQPLLTESSDQRNTTIAGARLMRLDFERPKKPSEPYEQFYQTLDNDSAIRTKIYNLLNSIIRGAKVSLVEQADLILACGYSPFNDVDLDNREAHRLLEKYLKITCNGQTAHLPAHLLQPAQNHVKSIPAVPYHTHSNQQLDDVKERAQNLWLESLKRQANQNDEDQNNSMNDNDDNASQSSHNSNPSSSGSETDDAFDDNCISLPLDDASVASSNNSTFKKPSNSLVLDSFRIDQFSDDKNKSSVSDRKKRKHCSTIISDDESLTFPQKSQKNYYKSTPKEMAERNTKIKASYGKYIATHGDVKRGIIAEISRDTGYTMPIINYWGKSNNIKLSNFEESREEKKLKNQEIALLVEQNPEATHQEIADMAGVDKYIIDNWLINQGKTKQKKSEQNQRGKEKKEIVLSLKQKNENLNHNEIYDLVLSKGHDDITREQVKTIIKKSPFKSSMTFAPPLTEDQKNKIDGCLKRKSNGDNITFKQISKEVACSVSQVKKYNKDKKIK